MFLPQGSMVFIIQGQIKHARIVLKKGLICIVTISVGFKLSSLYNRKTTNLKCTIGGKRNYIKSK